MTAQVKVWENSQGIRLPKNLREGNGVYLNDSLTIEVQGDKIISTKTFEHKTLEERTAECSGNLGLYELYEWGESVGREQW